MTRECPISSGTPVVGQILVENTEQLLGEAALLGVSCAAEWLRNAHLLYPCVGPSVAASSRAFFVGAATRRDTGASRWGLMGRLRGCQHYDEQLHSSCATFNK